MPLLEHDAFAHVVAPFGNLRVGFLPMPGNIGDRLIDLGARQLFDTFEIDYRQLDRRRLFDDRHMDRVEAIVVSGGGNLGSAYQEPLKLRKLALQSGRPVYILPQSVTNTGEDLGPYAGVFLRERYSLALAPGGHLGPDPALAVDYPWDPGDPAFATGVFLRTNHEGLFSGDHRSVADPVRCCETVHQYLRLAATFGHVITDRLHFAIAALLMGRKATLLRNGYHKNQGMYEAWLGDLGCAWRDDLEGVDFDPGPVRRALGTAVSGYPSRLVDWNARPILTDLATGSKPGGDPVPLGAGDGIRLRTDDAERRISRMMDGGYGTGEVAALLAGAQADFTQCPWIQVNDFVRRGWKRGILTPYDNVFARDFRLHDDVLTLDVQPPQALGEHVRLSATLGDGVEPPGEIWFEVGGPLRSGLTSRADPFVLASLHYCMRSGRDLWVRGAPVSASLLYNLQEFQRAWHCWNPGLAVIRIIGEILDDPAVTPSGRAISCFSGGLDSTETVHRHGVLRESAIRYHLDTALMIHGFDIPWEDKATFETAIARVRKFLPVDGVALEVLKTNMRDFARDWPEAHGLAAAAALTLFCGTFSHGLIPSTFAYNAMMPWGSNPMTDGMMGSDVFRIVHDGAHLNRLEKISALTAWPAALRNLRVCWQEGYRGNNCGTCTKCVMTGLMARVAGVDAGFLGPGFNEESVARVLSGGTIARADWLDARALFREASLRGIDAPWVARLAALRPV